MILFIVNRCSAGWWALFNNFWLGFINDNLPKAFWHFIFSTYEPLVGKITWRTFHFVQHGDVWLSPACWFYPPQPYFFKEGEKNMFEAGTSIDDEFVFLFRFCFHLFHMGRFGLRHQLFNLELSFQHTLEMPGSAQYMWA